MSSFFQQTAKARIAKHLDRFPLLKLDQVIDWRPIERCQRHVLALRNSPLKMSNYLPSLNLMTDPWSNTHDARQSYPFA
ncbi:hypothetical protein AAEX37_00520 [Oligella sp. MSHR50489EDL]